MQQHFKDEGFVFEDTVCFLKYFSISSVSVPVCTDVYHPLFLPFRVTIRSWDILRRGTTDR